MVKQNERLRQIRIGTGEVVGARWTVLHRLGEGAFGVVYACTDAQATPAAPQLAIKAEIIGVDRVHESLKMEIYVMRKMMSVSAVHSVQLLDAGSEKNFNYVVMTLLGMSLSDIRKRLPDEKFSLDSLAIIGLQATDALRELHSAGFVHRDIKPSNFALGKEKVDWIYLIDFGICREIMYYEDLETKLKCPRRTTSFRGTARYCSINAHKRKELGRHDDLLSMMYMLIEGHAGTLPWKHRDRETTERLKTEKEAEMLAATALPFKRLYVYLRELNYFITPDYKRVRAEFTDIVKERNLAPPFKLDWDGMEQLPFDRSSAEESGCGEQKGGGCLSRSTAAVKSLSRENLFNPADINTLYDIPDEFPHEESCSDTDRTISSIQEQRAMKNKPIKTEETQLDENEKASSSSSGCSPYCPSPSKTAQPVPSKEEKREEAKKSKREPKIVKDERPPPRPSPATASPASSTPTVTPVKQPPTPVREKVALTPLKKTERDKKRKEQDALRQRRKEERERVPKKKSTNVWKAVEKLAKMDVKPKETSKPRATPVIGGGDKKDTSHPSNTARKKKTATVAAVGGEAKIPAAAPARASEDPRKNKRKRSLTKEDGTTVMTMEEREKENLVAKAAKEDAPALSAKERRASKQSVYLPFVSPKEATTPDRAANSDKTHTKSRMKSVREVEKKPSRPRLVRARASRAASAKKKAENAEVPMVAEPKAPNRGMELHAFIARLVRGGSIGPARRRRSVVPSPDTRKSTKNSTRSFKKTLDKSEKKAPPPPQPAPPPSQQKDPPSRQAPPTQQATPPPTTQTTVASQASTGPKGRRSTPRKGRTKGSKMV